MLDFRNNRTRWNLAMVTAVILVYLVIQFLHARRFLLSYHLQMLSLASIHIILVVSLNIINGFTGQLSIGHAGFMAVGAYLSAALTVFYQVPFVWAVLIAGVAASMIGIIIGLPTLRLRGDYLAIATLGFGEIIRVVILNIRSVGGPRGFTGIPRYTSFGLTYFLMVITIIILKNFIDSKHGRACIAVREDEIASDSLGINTTYAKVMAFALGSFFAGIAGALFSHYMQFITPAPSQIGFLKSIDLLIMVVLGGLGSLTGSVIAALFLTILPEALRGFAEYRMIVYPVILIFVMLFRPSGLMAGHELTFEFLQDLVSRLRRNMRGKEVNADGSSQ